MGFLWGKTNYIASTEFAAVTDTLARFLETLREEFIFGSLSQLKREGVDVSKVPKNIVPGSELEDVLVGFQLTSMMGIAYDYIEMLQDHILFDETLSKRLDAGEGSRAWRYRERYTDCQGNMDELVKCLCLDVHKAIGLPMPREEFLLQFLGGAYILMGLCQAVTYSACGDSKMELKIRQKLFRG